MRVESEGRNLMQLDTRTSSRRLVLVADDSWAICRSLKLALEPTYHVITANSGTEAMRLCRECRPDVLILDMLMPDAGGFEVLAGAISDDRSPRVIFLTVLDDCGKAANAIKLGADDYLVKPCPSAVVRSTVDRLLDGGRPRCVPVTAHVAPPEEPIHSGLLADQPCES